MSHEAAVNFRKLVGQDRDLQQKVAAALRGQADLEAIVAMGAERECQFTAEEARSLIQHSLGDDAKGELNDFELELVAGGAGKSIQMAVPGSPAPDARYGAGAVTRRDAQSVAASARLGKF